MLTREQMLDRLQAYAAQEGVVTAEWLRTHDAPLYRGVLAEFGGMEAARRDAGIPQPEPGSEWSEARVVNELRQLQHAGRVRITSSGLRAAGHEALLSAIYLHVGSMGRARRLARIPNPGNKPTESYERWDEDRVVSEIRERHRNGEPLASSKVPDTLKQAATAYCGSWQAAIEIAGFDYDEVRAIRRPWTREELLAELTRVAQARVQNPDGPSMAALIAPFATAMRALLGDLPSALRAAGVDPATVMDQLPFERRSDVELVAELRAAVVNDPPATSREFFTYTRLGREAMVRFGSMRAAIDQIGDVWPAKRALRALSAEEVIAALQTRHHEGRTLSCTQLRHEDTRLVNSATKHFGSWGRAMRAAGLGALVGRSPAVGNPSPA